MSAHKRATAKPPQRSMARPSTGGRTQTLTGAPGAEDALLRLQQSAGNAAVGQLLNTPRDESLAMLLPPWRPRALVVARQPAGTVVEGAPAETTQGAGEPAVEPPKKPSVDDEDIAWIPNTQKGSPPIGVQIDDWAAASKERAALAEEKTATDRQLGALLAKELPRIRKLPTDQQPVAEDALRVRVDELKQGLAGEQAAISQRYADARIANRKRFMARMSCFLETKEKVKAHYSALSKADVPGTVWLAEPAARRLEMVRRELLQQGLDMPRSWNAQDLRSRHLHDMGLGMMAHPLGYSVDFLADENPKIAEPRLVRLLGLEAGGREKTAMKLAAPAETGTSPAHPKGLTADRARRLRYIAGMGESAAAAQAGGGAFDEAGYGTFLGKVDEQFRLVSAASEAFKASIPEAAQNSLTTVGERFRKNLPTLDAEVKDKRKALQTAQTAATAALAGTGKKKAKPTPEAIAAQPGVIAATQQVTDATVRREELIESMKQELRTIFKPWIGRISAKVKELNAIAPGGDLARVPTVAEFDTAIKAITAMQDSVSKIQALSGQPGKEQQVEKLRTAVTTTWQKHTGLFLRINEVGRSAPIKNAGDPNAELLQRVTWLRDWRLANQAGIAKAASEISEWGRVERALTDFQFVFVGKGTVEDPSVQQLVTKGYFGGRTTVSPGAPMTPAEANRAGQSTELDRSRFNIIFFQTMVKYGFDPGVAWSPGSTDPMHFDFAAGLLAVKSGSECLGPGVNP